MFESGKKYNIETINGYDEKGNPVIEKILSVYIVDDTQLPLITINVFGKSVTINTSSPLFFRATVVE